MLFSARILAAYSLPLQASRLYLALSSKISSVIDVRSLTKYHSLGSKDGDSGGRVPGRLEEIGDGEGLVSVMELGGRPLSAITLLIQRRSVTNSSNGELELVRVSNKG